ncbi:dash complex subunit dad1 [Ophiostoma piceae UAMH 11346]|uniref:DASH complex subunit DAD1 n=1 Tax=Ophiostoma piceae (strain UAMH 11346) TaxID=1262450 RepID=S3C784_OPHP1|nr:dash complex subunit dad1 [Ophiostoma piceae UAMH 11346]
MSSRPAASSVARKTYFEQQRELLLGEIAMSFEQVLANINKLNRSLEAVTTVGNEFSAVEALWSQFESVMAKDDAPAQPEEQDQAQAEGHLETEGHEEGQDEQELQEGQEGRAAEDEEKSEMELDY